MHNPKQPEVTEGLRPAYEIASEICGCANREQHRRDIALIEADRAAVAHAARKQALEEAARVADEIADKWGRDNRAWAVRHVAAALRALIDKET